MAAMNDPFLIVTDRGNNEEIIIDRYPSEGARLKELHSRAQAYYAGTRFALPTLHHEEGEAQALATLLGFFLMLTNGSVSLVDETNEELDYQAHIFVAARCLFCNVSTLGECVYGPFDCIPRGQYIYTSESANHKEAQS